MHVHAFASLASSTFLFYLLQIKTFLNSNAEPLDSLRNLLFRRSRKSRPKEHIRLDEILSLGRKPTAPPN